MLDGIEAVFFDMDGTLIDSMNIAPKVDIKFLARHNIDLKECLTEKFYGMSFTQTIEYFKNEYKLPGTIKEINDEWVNIAYETYLEEAPLKGGAYEILEYLHKNHIRAAIVTSNSRRIAEGISKHNKIDGFLEAIYTSCDVDKAKPEPDVYLHAAKNFNIDPSKCLVFEDSAMGILAGVRAGMRVCAIYDEPSAKEDEKKRELAHYYIKDFTNVLNGTYEKLH